MALIIRRALPADAAELVRVQVAAFHYDSVIYPDVEIGGPPGYESQEVMLQKIAEDEAYTFRLDEQIVGGMVIFKESDGHYHLDVIFLEPARHNQGIGTQAMHFLDEVYPDASLWTLNTPTYAIRNQHFYEKMGYVRVGLSEIDGFPLIDYERRV